MSLQLFHNAMLSGSPGPLGMALAASFLFPAAGAPGLLREGQAAV